MRFGQGSHFHNVNVQGEVASGDMEAATRFPGNLAKINNNNSSDNCVDCLHCRFQCRWNSFQLEEVAI